MSRLQEEVASIEEQLGAMADLALSMLKDGVRSLIDLDRDLAQDVRGRIDALAQMDEDIETQVITTMTLQAPVAGDARRVAAALKLITYLNRVGRYGRDVAKVAADWPDGTDHVARMVSLPTMAEKVEAMLRQVLDAFDQGAAPDTEAIMALEADVDAMRYSVWREALTYMAEDPHTLERCAHYMMVARYLERCGDNIVKMAEKLHWAATGQRVLLQ